MSRARNSPSGSRTKWNSASRNVVTLPGAKSSAGPASNGRGPPSPLGHANSTISASPAANAAASSARATATREGLRRRGGDGFATGMLPTSDPSLPGQRPLGQASLQRQRIGQRHLQPIEDGPLGQTQRQRRPRHERPRQRLRLLVQAVAGDDALDEAATQGGGGIDRVASEDHLHGDAGRDVTGQRLGAAG